MACVGLHAGCSPGHSQGPRAPAPAPPRPAPGPPASRPPAGRLRTLGPSSRGARRPERPPESGLALLWWTAVLRSRAAAGLSAGSASGPRPRPRARVLAALRPHPPARPAPSSAADPGFPQLRPLATAAPDCPPAASTAHAPPRAARPAGARPRPRGRAADWAADLWGGASSAGSLEVRHRVLIGERTGRRRGKDDRRSRMQISRDSLPRKGPRPWEGPRLGRRASAWDGALNWRDGSRRGRLCARLLPSGLQPSLPASSAPNAFLLGLPAPCPLGTHCKTRTCCGGQGKAADVLSASWFPLWPRDSHWVTEM